MPPGCSSITTDLAHYSVNSAGRSYWLNGTVSGEPASHNDAPTHVPRPPRSSSRPGKVLLGDDRVTPCGLPIADANLPLLQGVRVGGEDFCHHGPLPLIVAAAALATCRGQCPMANPSIS